MSENINLDDIRKLSEEVNSLVQSGVIPLNDNTKKVIDKFDNLVDSLNKVKMDDLSKSVKKVTDSFGDLTKATKDLIEEEEEGAEALAKSRLNVVKQFARDMGNAAGAFVSAVNSAEAGTAKYARSAEALGKAAANLGSSFGFSAELIGKGAEKLAQWAGYSLKQNDILVKSFQQLSKFGQVDTTDLKQLMGDFHEMGAVTENMHIYINAISKVSSELAMFGNSAAEGRHKFGEVMNNFLDKDVQDHFMRLGYTTQDIMESASQAAANLALSASSQAKDSKALHTSVAEYLETQSELTALTGQNRDEMIQARRAQEEDVAFQMKLQEMEARGEREKAQQWRDAAAMGYLLKGKEGQLGVQQGLRTNGALVGPESRQLAQAIGLNNWKNLIAAGNVTGTREQRANALVSAGQGAAQGGMQWAKTMQTAMDYSRTGYNASVGMNPEFFKRITNLKDKGVEAIEEVRRLSKVKGESDRIGMESERATYEREFQQTADKATYAMGDLVVPAINTMAGALNDATQAIVGFTDAMNMTDSWNSQRKSFDKLTDVTEELNKQQKKQAEYLKEINEANDEMAQADQDISDAEAAIKKGGLAGMWAEMRLGKFKENKQAAVEKKARAEQGYSKAEKAGEAAARQGTRIQQAGGDVLKGLPVYSKSGDAHQAGNFVDPKMVELMWKIKNEIPGFSHFTSVNDKYHHDKNPGSAHAFGRAVDFVLDHDPTKDEVKKIMEQLRGMGLKPFDEYYGSSANKTGNHMHAQLGAKTGGVFSGPNSGYQVELHGKEAVIPMSKIQSMFGSVYDTAKSVTKHSLTNPGTAVSTPVPSQEPAILRQLMNLLIGRLDDMIYELQSANSASAKIAKNTKKK